MQKLIDELKLYPGKDQIPTEIADKILAVYQVNAGEVAISNTLNNIIKEGFMHDTTGDTSVIIYATPTDKKFYLTGFFLHHDYIGGITWSWLEATIDGLVHKFGDGVVVAATSSSKTIAVTFNNPILLDQNTNVILSRTTSNRGVLNAQIFGYIKD